MILIPIFLTLIAFIIVLISSVAGLVKSEKNMTLFSEQKFNLALKINSKYCFVKPKSKFFNLKQLTAHVNSTYPNKRQEP